MSLPILSIPAGHRLVPPVSRGRCSSFQRGIFLLTVHWPLEAQRTLDDYNLPQDDIVAQSAGSAVRQVVLIVLCGLWSPASSTRPSTVLFVLMVLSGLVPTGLCRVGF